MIKFGTDGWRARIADDFTFQNVRLVTQALVDYVNGHNIAAKGIAIGYDNRFQSENFAQAAAEVCSGAGLKTLLTAHSIPSPVLSYTVRNHDLAAGIMITASHNPPEWNGFKIKENFGGSAFPETTQMVEKKIADKLKITLSTDHIQKIDPDDEYFKKITSLVDLDLIKSAKIKIVVDPMFGSGAGYFQKLGLPVTEIRGVRDPLFGGINPEPLPVNLTDSFSFTMEVAQNNPADLTACIVLDGDADRISAIDGSGRFINTHNVFTLLLRHLVKNRHMTGEVIKTFNMSNLIDKLCLKYNVPLTVTPIGFKYIAKQMLEKDVLLGGEESGGMAIKGFIPERDGILAGLYLLELIATEKKSLAQILNEIMAEEGTYYYNRIDLHLKEAQNAVKRLLKNPPKTIANFKVQKVATLDGLKLYLANDSWLLFRASGTEPLLRIYAEGHSIDELKLTLGAGEQIVKEALAA